MSLPTQRRVWILANPPLAAIEPDTFRLDTQPLPPVADGQLLIQVEYLSNDPAQRGWMQKDVDPVSLPRFLSSLTSIGSSLRAPRLQG